MVWPLNYTALTKPDLPRDHFTIHTLTTALDRIVITTRIKESKHDFSSIEDLDKLIHAMKDKKVVMLDEASHGTHEYYKWRSRISKKPVSQMGNQRMGRMIERLQ